MARKEVQTKRSELQLLFADESATEEVSDVDELFDGLDYTSD